MSIEYISNTTQSQNMLAIKKAVILDLNSKSYFIIQFN